MDTGFVMRNAERGVRNEQSRDHEKCGTFHEPASERGCVEDQPQRVATFAAAAAGAPLPRTQPRSVCQSVHGPNTRETISKGALHEPHAVFVWTILPHPGPLPLGEGELSADDWR